MQISLIFEVLERKQNGNWNLKIEIKMEDVGYNQHPGDGETVELCHVGDFPREHFSNDKCKPVIVY